MTEDLVITYKGQPVVQPGELGYLPRTIFPPGVWKCLVERLDIDNVTPSCDVHFCDDTAGVVAQGVPIENVYATENEAFAASVKLLVDEIDVKISHAEDSLKELREDRARIVELADAYKQRRT